MYTYSCGYLQHTCACILDDVVIHSNTWEDHIRHIGEILLGCAGLTVKPKKCQFAMAQCTYLGHVVGNGEVRPEQPKLQEIHQVSFSLTKNLVAVQQSCCGLSCMFCYKRKHYVLHTATTFFVNEEKLNNGYSITATVIHSPVVMYLLAYRCKDSSANHAEGG